MIHASILPITPSQVHLYTITPIIMRDIVAAGGKAGDWNNTKSESSRSKVRYQILPKNGAIATRITSAGSGGNVSVKGEDRTD
ncbi:hypothetical protein NPIL_467771 [Nephila pilipes]|uniref:Uncharacterized protein n=1 Tax=Nephila pilipes TaxID=299642 RepID=A0A8X6PJ07_NEPPI|nr:hypothetical protein NPIL_467771 [Nephila pilipes]